MQKTNPNPKYNYYPLVEFFENTCSPEETASTVEVITHFMICNEEKAGLAPSPKIHNNLFSLVQALKNMEKTN